jgi:hypothetical protein
MPTVFRSGPYRFFFFAGDADEPPHVHVEPDDSVCKFWLTPCRLAMNNGFQPAEVRAIGRLVEDHAGDFLEQWHEFFDGDERRSDPAD